MLAVLDLRCRVDALPVELVQRFMVIVLLVVEKPRVFSVQRDWFPVKQDISDAGAFPG